MRPDGGEPILLEKSVDNGNRALSYHPKDQVGQEKCRGDSRERMVGAMLDLATTSRGVLMIIFAVLMVGALPVGLGFAGFH
jgi:hypothetical protein